MNIPPLGWIDPDDRSDDQNAAHEAAEATMPAFALPAWAEPARGTKVNLFDFCLSPEVVADCGITFDRAPFRQLTGSCVGAGGGNALFTLIGVQRVIGDNPTKAIIPFWPFSYARTRYLEGDRGQGEGAVGSVFAQQIKEEGVLSIQEAGLPAFRPIDGLILTDVDDISKNSAKRLEYLWSDGGTELVTKHLPAARQHPLGTAARLRSTEEIKQAVINGYPGSIACSRFIGKASVRGSGANAAVCGSWDTSGPHQQWFFGYWDNPELGPLFAIGNNWWRTVYPQDPAGLPLVCCWATEKAVAAMLTYRAEVYAFSHLNWFPAQPKVLDWLIAP